MSDYEVVTMLRCVHCKDTVELLATPHSVADTPGGGTLDITVTVRVGLAGPHHCTEAVANAVVRTNPEATR